MMSPSSQRPRIELHCHTTSSDGSLTPTELVERAVERNVTHLAITDHDTVGGLAEARMAAEGRLEIISGIEVSSYHHYREVHVLGYFFDPEEARLLTFLEEMQGARKTRMEQMLERLSEAGIEISLDEVLEQAAGDSVGRPHLADALVARELVVDREHAFEAYLGNKGPIYVPRRTVTVAEAIELLKGCGAAVVLAHPGLLFSRALAAELLELPFDGLEVWHPAHQKKDQKRFLRMARSREKIPTGGSDFHQPGSSSRPELGSMRVPLETVEKLRAAGRFSFGEGL